MDEAEAKAWLSAEFDVPRETMERLDAFAAMLREENARQNLVSAASLDHLWARHIVDSAQLLRFSPFPEASWVDLGSGAGFPGLIVALLHAGPVTLIEERRLRVDFLARAAERIGADVDLVGSKVEKAKTGPFDVISARAFAPLPRLLELGTAFSTAKTIWVLPKGRNAQSELEALESSWQGSFRLEPSVTDAHAAIIVAEAVGRTRAASRKAKRKNK